MKTTVLLLIFAACQTYLMSNRCAFLATQNLLSAIRAGMIAARKLVKDGAAQWPKYYRVARRYVRAELVTE